MIVANQKPFEQVKGFVDEYDKVLVAGCGTCVTVCHAGGQKEVGMLVSGLKIAYRLEDREKTFFETTVQRQCDEEFIEPLMDIVKKGNVDAVLTLACGVGVNFLADRLEGVPVFPGVNTSFYGAAVEHGVWQGMCAGCGDCITYLTGGICPVARCTKSLINGPCGGMNNGKCEISPDVDCGWHLIINRMKQLGKYKDLLNIVEPRDWTNFGTVGSGMQKKRDIRGSIVDPEVEAEPAGEIRK